MSIRKLMTMLAMLVVFAPVAQAEEAATAETAPATESSAAEAVQDAVEGRMLLAQKLEHDTVYGKDDALITLVEYGSLTCSHCRDFYVDIFEELKKNYVDTGKVKFVYRHYPLNLNALRAAQVLECGVTDPEKKKLFLGAMFQSQPEWAYKEDEKDVLAKLKDIAKLGGIDTSKFDECAKNKELEDAMLRQQLLTQKALGIGATPSLYINSKKYFDKKDYASVAKAVDEAYSNIGKEEEAADVAAEAAEEAKTE